MVIKNDGTKQSFELKKIRRGIEKACEKRPVQKETIDGIVERIRLSVLDQYDDEVSSKEIGRMVLKELRQADQVAFARFSMIHHEINDLHGFIKELERLI